MKAPFSTFFFYFYFLFWCFGKFYCTLIILSVIRFLIQISKSWNTQSNKMKWSSFGGALYSAVNQMSFSQQNVLLQFQLKSAKTLSIVFIIAAIFQLVQMGRSFSRANYSGRREWAEEGEQMNPFGFISKALPPVTWFLFVSVIFSLCANSKQGHTRPKSKWSSSFGWQERHRNLSPRKTHSSAGYLSVLVFWWVFCFCFSVKVHRADTSSTVYIQTGGWSLLV